MDDLGTAYDGPRPARRVVSLVPSLTEALASVDRDAVVGATDWCTHPADLGAARVRGTKNPDLAAVRALEPDVVVANQEENRELDVRRLRESGVRVWVTRIETVPEAVGSMERLLDGLGWERPTWLGEARRLWCGPVPPVSRRVAIPVWRDPWMVVGARTFTGDLARRLGLDNVFADHPDRYPARPPSRSSRPPLTSCCSPTSPTSSPPTTARRCSRAARTARAARAGADGAWRPSWSAVGC